jgi:hypothetical protein
MTLYVIGSFFPALAARDRVKRYFTKNSCTAKALGHQGETNSVEGGLDEGCQVGGWTKEREAYQHEQSTSS